MKKISVIIVEDHKMIREMWENMFAGNNEIELIGQTGEFDEAIEMIKTRRPDIVLLDINLPVASGMDAVPLIRQFAPSSKIIAVSMHNQPAYAKKMLKLGAKGYVTKSSSLQEILDAVGEVMKGNTYVCLEIKNTLLGQLLGDEPSGGSVIKNLSLREIEIIKLIKKGLSSKEIATSLSIAIRTVEVHRYNILKKLSLKNTASLISFINDSDLNF
ncbi:MAG: two component transcriptional regulator, LuxR family [Chitinophagaceae bacterium]|nr:two component transcriptional regulator, LuxR family [Chitinophagaceae bacterium]